MVSYNKHSVMDQRKSPTSQDVFFALLDLFSPSELTFTTQGKFNRQQFDDIFFLFFSENRLWCFMQIVALVLWLSKTKTAWWITVSHKMSFFALHELFTPSG